MVSMNNMMESKGNKPQSSQSKIQNTRDINIFDMEDILNALKYSYRNINLIRASSICGCFYCLRIFSSEDIEEFWDSNKTGVCPYCGRDSVIPSESNYPITTEFLMKMRIYYYGPFLDENSMYNEREIPSGSQDYLVEDSEPAPICEVSVNKNSIFKAYAATNQCHEKFGISKPMYRNNKSQ